MSLLKIENLYLSFGGVEIIHGIDLEVKKGEFVALVGESGSGKSVTALSLMGLLPHNAKITQGSIVFNGKELIGLSPVELDKIRGSEMTMVFQDALTSLNPVLTIGSQLTEGMIVHMGYTKKQAEERALYLLDKVGLNSEKSQLKRYPHTLSGGQRQRVSIAMALACNPKLLIADEPTTALDVTVQAQIMDLLGKIQRENKMSVVFITHDLALAAHQADKIAVMYQGEIVEFGDAKEVLNNPQHEYTCRLAKAAEKVRLK